jgi:hypothetical protein
LFVTLSILLGILVFRKSSNVSPFSASLYSNTNFSIDSFIVVSLVKFALSLAFAIMPSRFTKVLVQKTEMTYLKYQKA